MSATFASAPTLTRLRWLGILLGIAASLLSFRANAQLAGTGSIQGTVSDTSGAVIQNAMLTATNEATHVKHVVTTDIDGLYSFPNLAVGTYTVDSSAQGFENYSRSHIVLEVGSSIAVNISMNVGGTNQTVEVSENGLALQTEDPSFKQTIDQQTLTEMALNGRQVTSLILLSGGSTQANESNDLQGSKTFFSSVVISVAGGQGNATDYRLDGGDHNDYMTNINLPFPFPDAVSQFSVETISSANSGLHPGGLVNVVTRSGSDEWHGTGFEFIRNNYIDATNFFSVSKDTLHQNQYGGTFGGRIIRDKLFFFGGYQRLQSDQSQNFKTAYVPTAANLQGDFSASDPTIQLLDPATGIELINNKYSDTPGVTWAPNTAALAVDKYLPPTTAANGLVTYAIPSEVGENQVISRVDWTINSKQSLYGRYFLDGYQSPSFFSPTNILITGQSGNFERVQAFTLGETDTISPHMVNTFHASATRRRDNRGPLESAGVNASTFGISMDVPYPIGMGVSVSSKWSMYSGAAAHFNVNTFPFADDINWIRGKHQIAFGGEYVRSELNVNNEFDANGAFGFSGIFSQKGPGGTSAGGTGEDANLDFLTGSMSSFAQSPPQQNALRAPLPSLYFNDVYQAGKRLTLSAGLRWDPEFMPADYFHRGSTFSMSGFLNNTHSMIFPNAPAGSFYYGDPGVPKAFTKNSLWQFSPRLGATWAPPRTSNTVFRVGAALIYDEVNFFTAQETNFNPPYAQTITNVPVGVPLNFSSPWSNGTVTSNPFPAAFLPTGPSTTFPNSGQYFVLPAQFHPPYSLEWTASIEQNFGHGWQFLIDYIGSKTDFNPYGYPINPAVYIPGTWTGPGSCGSLAVSPGTGEPCSSTGNQASRFALTLSNPSQGPKYLGGENGVTLSDAGVNASYNGMVVTIQHRMSSAFVLLANYTWSKCLDIEDNSGDVGSPTVQNPANLKGDRAICGFDYRNVFNSSVVASSHFSLTGWKALALNNWEIAPLVHITDGLPVTVLSGLDNALTDGSFERPNLVNPSEVYTRKTIRSGQSINAQFLNASAFSQNATGMFGDSPRNGFRGPSFIQVDSAVDRSFPLHEGLAIQLRLEAFNVLNHPDFGAPGSNGGQDGSTTSLSSSTFGQITSTVSSEGARIFQGAIKLTF